MFARYKPCLFFASAWLATTLAVAGVPPPAAIQYNRDIRPILSEHCFSCHGPDSASRKAGLRLDHIAGATNLLESGAVAIVPGHPDQSELVRRVLATDEDQMPPATVNKPLRADQQLVLRQWVATGAKYEAHWSFIPPVKAPMPAVKNRKWVRNPIDHFILARLETGPLKPNAEADRRTLIRRVSLDLTGLPPQPGAVEQFLADPAPDAYEKLVDRLLASPAWGEHRGRYWLDAARYGDTHGIHFDNFREMWTYRDWVIHAFNQNMPFDEFTIENLAGDLLPEATRDQKIGSGFNRCHVTSNEGGSIDEEVLVNYTRDRTETTAQTWLGLTVGCAVCHDHKYDPLTQRDFYSLSAFFNNTTQKAMDGNIKDTPPVLVVPKPEDDARWEQLGAEIPVAETNVVFRKFLARGDFTNWLAQPYHAGISRQPTVERLVFAAPLDEGAGDQIHFESAGTNLTVPLGANTNWQAGVVAVQAYTVSGSNAVAFAGAGDFERTNSFSYAAWVRLAGEHDGALFARMNDQDDSFRGWDLFLAGGKPVFHLIHHWPENALKVSAKQALPKDRWNHVAVTYDGTSKAKGVKLYVNGQVQEPDVLNDTLQDTTRTGVPLKLGQRESALVVAGAGLQDLKIFSRVLPAKAVADLGNLPRLQWLAARPQRSQAETEELFTLWLNQADGVYRNFLANRDRLKEEQLAIRKRGTVAYVMNERTNAPEAHVLFRGAYDQRREPVGAATPEFLPPLPGDLARNRLGFAQWLLRPENPLPARVTVNRFWQELFGTGLVKTAGDFGVSGEPPSHPELLDWLAVDFRDHNWDVKRIFKLMVMSATYRQSAANSPEKIERDPENRLLARGPRFRMDAEMIRDSALAASGLLVAKIGGPSTRPYQPPGIWDQVGMPEGDTRNYVQDHGDNLYRRSVYTFWKRQAAPASLEILNAPSREVCTVRRERTDTPLQALVTLNDPQFIEAARQLAQASLTSKTDAFDFMAQRLLARPLSAKEKRIVKASAADLLAYYQGQPKQAEDLLKIGELKPDAKLDAPTLAAYTMVANELMNLDEVLNK
jgi:hypothetical protein